MCVCLKVGRNCNLSVSDMSIGSTTISWVKNLKYLGISFVASSSLQFDCNPVNQKFYGSFNSLMRGCNTDAENVKVFLTKTSCLPLLTYSIGALKLSSAAINSVGVCWNDAFRKIFGCNRWESVSHVQYCFGELSFAYIYDLYRWNFLHKCLSTSDSVSYLAAIVNSERDELNKFAELYGNDCSLPYLRKQAVMKHFQNYCMMDRA